MAEESTRKKKKKIIVVIGLLAAFLGGVGVGLQNTFAVFDLLTLGHFAASSAIPCAILAGGFCSTLINFFLNTDLLYNFWIRISKHPLPKFYSTGQVVQYWLGTFIFICTGILFGLTAFSVASSAGGLSALDGYGIAGIVAGIFVAIISVPQELETWLASFDHPITVELEKALTDLKEIKADDNELLEEVIQDLFEDLQEKIRKQIKSIKDHRIKRPDFAKAKLEELQNWFEGLYDRDSFKNLSDTITKINAKQILDEQELKDLKKAFFKAIEIELNAAKKDRKTAIANLQLLKNSIETPLQKKYDKLSIWDTIFGSIQDWATNLTFGKFVGLILSLANVMSLSLLFTIGLTTALTYIGVPALPALISGFSLAFSIGAYTEFYFYHYFLADFCDQITDKWIELWKQPNPVVGILLVAVNAAVNGALAYFSIQMLDTLFSAAGIPIPSLEPLCIASATFAGAASFLLGSDFWIQNAKRFTRWLTGKANEAPTKEDGSIVKIYNLKKTIECNFKSTLFSTISKNADENEDSLMQKNPDSLLEIN